MAHIFCHYNFLSYLSYILTRDYDYIITGTGAAGLLLAYRMANDSYFDDKSILIIDKEKKVHNDRTWCFWEKDAGEWDHILYRSWKSIEFKSDTYRTNPQIAPYVYKMIRSGDFYQFLWNVISKKENIGFCQDTVINISHKKESASVLTEKTEYHARKLFNSIVFNQTYNQQSKYPVLKQHFIGWFVETDEDAFDDSSATFMDFTVEQKGNTRFMYVLPLSSQKALVEYTLFSDKLLDDNEYEQEIEKYLKKKSINSFKIIEKEKGIIPMTSYKFWNYNSTNVLNIGTAGGWSKASTGYTFLNITKKTKEVVSFLKTEKTFKSFHKQNRFWYYDLLLLDVLSKENHWGSRFFSILFRKNSVQKIFKFLDEETRFSEELKIMWSMPSLKFIRALLRRVF